MVRPHNFTLNEETAKDNVFQDVHCSTEDAAKLACSEFDAFVKLIQAAGVEVEVFTGKYSPDAVFPNNWISTHNTIKPPQIQIYPLMAESRRRERTYEITKFIEKHYDVKQFYGTDRAFQWLEMEGLYMEGTGSLILDRQNSICYACVSQRTNPKLVTAWCGEMGYTPIIFDAVDANGLPYYHTNVIMSVCEKFVILCSEAIKDSAQREHVLKSIKRSQKELIEISYQQVTNFCGNVLQLISLDRTNDILVMSTRAKNGFTDTQIRYIESFGVQIVHSPLTTIENLGGGSARCMILENFLVPSLF